MSCLCEWCDPEGYAEWLESQTIESFPRDEFAEARTFAVEVGDRPYEAVRAEFEDYLRRRWGCEPIAGGTRRPARGPRA